MDLSHLTQWSAEYVMSRLEYLRKSAYVWDCNMLSDGYHFTYKRKFLHVKCIETILALPSLRDGSVYF